MRRVNTSVVRKVVYGNPPRVPPYAQRELESIERTIPRAIRDLLEEPTWSIKSLLPPKDEFPPNASSHNPPSVPDDEITPEKLTHLLRLSALSPPSSEEEEQRLLEALRTHVHFVKSIQSVDTSNVKPLITIRDETEEGIAEATVTLKDLQPHLDLEVKVGRNGTVRRLEKAPEEDDKSYKAKIKEDWWINPWRLGGSAKSRKVGKFMFVRRERKQKVNGEGTLEEDVGGPAAEESSRSPKSGGEQVSNSVQDETTGQRAP